MVKDRFPPEISNKARMSSHHSYSAQCWKVSIMRQEKEIKGIQIREKELKLSLFPEDMLVYKETAGNLPKPKDKKTYN